MWFKYKCIMSSVKVMEITRTQTKKKELINSKFKKVCYGNSRDRLVLRVAALVFTYSGVRFKALSAL